MIRARETAKKQGDYLFIGNIYAKMRSILPSQKTKKRKKQKKKEDEPIFTQRIMRWYADQLLRPTMKVIVLVVFAGLFAWSMWRTTLLRQAFNIEDYVPADSYTKTFFSSRTFYHCLRRVSIQILLSSNSSPLPPYSFSFSRAICKLEDVLDAILSKCQPV